MTKEIIKFKIKKLKAHPKQAANFYNLSPTLLHDLAEDMKIHGQKDPIEILPDGTLVCGHQRTGAAILLKWEEIDAWINHDLAAQGELAIEQRLIEDNLTRRSLDPLDKVKCYKRLHEIGDITQHRREHQRGRLRDAIGKRVGMSGRTLERYLRILDTPREVQDAFRAGQISLVNASKVAGLPQEVQQQLVAELREGKSPKQVVAARVQGRAPDSLDTALGPFIRSLERNVEAVEKEIGQVKSLSKYDVSILEQAQSLIGQMLDQVKEKNANQRTKKKQALASCEPDIHDAKSPATVHSCRRHERDTVALTSAV